MLRFSLDGEIYAAKSWTNAHERLVNNVKRQNFLPTEKPAVRVCVDSKMTVLPAYIPYIGPEYFQYRPRVLCYAINQNLSKHARWTDDWITGWGRNPDVAVDRLNFAVQAGKALPIKPYAEGFIPLAAGLFFWIHAHRSGSQLPTVIDRAIAVTNFVKFSTAADASSSSIPDSWWSECARRYVRHEIMVLRPNYVLAFGKRTETELRRILEGIRENGDSPRLIGCRFPGRIPSVRTRPLSRLERKIWEKDILPLSERLQRPRMDSYHRWRMLDFPGYFLDLITVFRNGCRVIPNKSCSR
jgi:hypothetical protein